MGPFRILSYLRPAYAWVAVCQDGFLTTADLIHHEHLQTGSAGWSHSADGLYTHRTAGRHRDHRHPCFDAPARATPGKVESEYRRLLEQPTTCGTCLDGGR